MMDHIAYACQRTTDNIRSDFTLSCNVPCPPYRRSCNCNRSSISTGTFTRCFQYQLRLSVAIFAGGTGWNKEDCMWGNEFSLLTPVFTHQNIRLEKKYEIYAFRNVTTMRPGKIELFERSLTRSF